MSDNPQSHHQSMMLLSAISKIFPERVLHNTMPIFTFIGSNLLRRDDDYSSQVISSVLNAVFPAMMSKYEKSGLSPVEIAFGKNICAYIFILRYIYISPLKREC